LHRSNGNGKENGSKRRRLIDGMSGSGRPDRVVPLDLRLRAISESIPASYIDEVWVFPPLPNRNVACEFLVLVCYDGGEDRRRILTSHVDALRPDPESDDLEWVQRLREHGTAPQHLTAEIPDRLLQRLSEAGTPEVIEVRGLAQTWQEAIARYADGAGAHGRDGNGNGEVSGKNGASGSLEILVDSRVTPEISFRTVIESPHPVGGVDGINPRPDS